MEGLTILGAGAFVGLLFAVAAWWDHRKAERLDDELTAYVAEGTMTAETVKAILASKANVRRKREVAALIAGGMDPDQAMSLLKSMAAA